MINTNIDRKEAERLILNEKGFITLIRGRPNMFINTLYPKINEFYTLTENTPLTSVKEIKHKFEEREFYKYIHKEINNSRRFSLST